MVTLGGTKEPGASLALSGEGDHTSIDWSAEVRIAGQVRSMGQRVLEPIVDQQVGNVLSAFEAKVAEAAAAPA
ncbi:MAG: SRPBCC domain-containing protein [Gaiella sp.]